MRGAPVPTIRPLRLRLSVACLLVLGASLVPSAAALAAPAQASPEYFLSIVEGETTRPEEPILSTSASVRHAHQVTLSIVRGGLVVAKDTGNEYAWLSQVPQPGDLVTVANQAEQVVGSVAYDGLPSLDPTVCVGSASFSGQRSAGDTVEGGYYSFGSHTDPYGHTNWFRTSSGQAQVTTLAGSGFAGNFLTPLMLGQTVWASESLQTPLPEGGTFTYSSENDRPVGACPLPPPPVVVPAPPALQGTLLKLVRTTIVKLLKSGWSDQVTINQPGKVVQDLYLSGGTLPAFASSAKAKRHKSKPKPKALLLARGSTSATTGGKVTVHLRVTARGRSRLKHATSVKAVLVTTLISKSGAKLSLGRRTVSLHR
jgi:hypothetical protein